MQKESEKQLNKHYFVPKFETEERFSVSKFEKQLMVKASELRPLHDWVLIRKHFTTHEKTSGGIFVAKYKEERPTEGRVVNVGLKVKDVKPGDYVHFHLAAGTTFEFHDEKFSIIKECDLNAIFVEDDDEKPVKKASKKIKKPVKRAATKPAKRKRR